MQFHYFKKIVSSSLVVLSLSGCVNTSVLTKKVEIPQWYLSVPSNNSVFIYGEGDSKHSISDAKNNALNTMAANLVVSVNSSTSSTTQSSMNGIENSYSKDVTRDIKVTVEKIKFTNAMIEKSEHVDGIFYLLMKVNREELFTNKKKELDIIDDRLTTQLNTLKNYTELEKINILQNMYPTIKTAKTQAVVLNAINNTFDQAPYIKKYDSYIDMIGELKNNSSIMVKTNDQKSYFADSLTNLLNQNQYKVSNNNKSDIIISLNNKAKYSIARGWNIAKVSTTISVISNNKIISNTIINSVGRSSTSKESALQNASQHFISQINEKTLDKIIFSR